MGHQLMGKLEQEEIETVQISCVVCVDVEVDDGWGELESGAEGTIFETERSTMGPANRQLWHWGWSEDCLEG